MLAIVVVKLLRASLPIPLSFFLLAISPNSASAQEGFVDVTESAGVSYTHGFASPVNGSDPRARSGGVAVGDYDADGLLDVFSVGGSAGRNHLFRNRGDGTFEDVAVAARVDLPGVNCSGPSFADIDGDGFLDLLVFANAADPESAQIALLRNLGNGKFSNHTGASGLEFSGDTVFSASLGDVDRDGDLDLFVTHWGSLAGVPPSGMLWRNEGEFVFVDVTEEAGFVHRDPVGSSGIDWTSTANFVDIDSDGWLDLLLASDLGTSQIFLNDGDGTFSEAMTGILGEDDAVGAAIGDYDNDGTLDWFLSTEAGGRLLASRGDGTFDDVTDIAGVGAGSAGRAASFGDLNHDGQLDLYVVRGIAAIDAGPDWFNDAAEPAQLFLSNGDGTFAEQGAVLGVADMGIGRGTALFDFDRDGDLDIFNQNAMASPVLYRNDLVGDEHFLVLRLIGRAQNREAVGARVTVSVDGAMQVREVRNGNNFVSSNPGELHFGLGSSERVDELYIRWPDGVELAFNDVEADRHLLLRHPGATLQTCSALDEANPCTLGGRMRSPVECLLEFLVSPTPPVKRNGPGDKIDCEAGDASCDADPEDLTSCSFDVALCPATRDPRNPACIPPDLNKLLIKNPHAASARERDRPARQLVEDLIGTGLAALTQPATSSFENLAPGTCTASERLVVPLRERSSGVFRANRMRIKIVGYSADGRRDVDKLVVRCHPPS